MNPLKVCHTVLWLWKPLEYIKTHENLHSDEKRLKYLKYDFLKTLPGDARSLKTRSALVPTLGVHFFARSEAKIPARAITTHRYFELELLNHEGYIKNLLK